MTTQATTQLLADKAGTIEHYPSGVPGSATVEVTKPNGDALTSGAATVDSASTTLTQDHEAGTKLLLVADSSAFSKGLRYLLSDEYKIRVVEVASVSTGKLRIATELSEDFSSGATLEGLRLSFAISSAYTSESDDNFLAAWEYVLDGVTHYEDTIFDVVESVDYFNATVVDLLAAYPSIAGYLESYELDGSALLKFVWHQRLKPLLAKKGVELRLIRSKAQLVPIHVELAYIHILKQSLSNESMAVFELHQLQAQDILGGLLATIDYYDADDSKTAEAAEEKPDFQTVTLSR